MNTKHPLIAIFLIAISVHWTGANGQNSSGSERQTWRCGNSYSDQHCPGGETVTVDDARSVSDQRAKIARTRAAERQAQAMARERQAEEKEAVKQRPVLMQPPPPAQASPAPPGKTHRPKKPGREDTTPFTARDPASPTPKK